MVYLFLGEDSLSKDARLKRIKEEFLAKDIEDFNLDTVYGKEVDLLTLQEKLLGFPVKSKKRILLIREAQELKGAIKEFILQYVKKPHPQLVLVLDITKHEAKDEFVPRIARYSQVCRFKESARVDTFALSRQIGVNRPSYALGMLSRLLEGGQKPEMILGGLRYTFERDTVDPLMARRRLKLLLHCDIDIKTGRLKPAFALERLVVKLCSLQKPF